MDTAQDMEDIAKLQKECEAHAEAGNFQDALKKARVGLINLKVGLMVQGFGKCQYFRLVWGAVFRHFRCTGMSAQKY